MLSGIEVTVTLTEVAAAASVPSSLTSIKLLWFILEIYKPVSEWILLKLLQAH